MPHRMLATREAAEYLHMVPADIEKMVRQKDIPFETKGRQVVFRKIDLDAWASRRILNLPDKSLKIYHQTTSARAENITVRGRLIVSELARTSIIKTGLVSRTKPSLLRDMVALAGKSGLLLDAKELLQSLELRESMCSTALPDGLALLHPRHHVPYMFEDSFIAFGRTIRAIPFGAPDGGETDLFFLICCQNDRLHLHVLARLCLMCRQKNFLAELRAADAPAEIHACLQRREQEAAGRNS